MIVAILILIVFGCFVAADVIGAAIYRHTVRKNWK